MLLVDVTPDSKLLLSVRNLQGARLVGVTHVTARDVMDARRVVATQAAIEAMQEGRWPDEVDRGHSAATHYEKDDDLARRWPHDHVPGAVAATKVEIRQAVEQLFNAKVASVRTSIVHGKMKRQGRFVGQRPDWKKAYVRLRHGEKMPEFLEGA